MKLKTLIVALAISTSAINTGYATGIPTFDGGNIATTIAENLKTLAQMKLQLDTLKSQIVQAKQFATETKNRLEGNWNLGDLITNDDFLSVLPDNARDIIISSSEILGLRKQYGLVSPNPEVQRHFDYLITKTTRIEKRYKNLKRQIKRLRKLRELANNATTPAQKADVQNKLSLTRLEMEQEQKAFLESEKMLAMNEELKEKARFEAFSQQLRMAKKAFHQSLNRNRY